MLKGSLLSCYLIRNHKQLRNYVVAKIKTGRILYMSEKKEKKKPRYHVFQNVTYVTKKLWEWDKSSILYMILSVPITIFLPLCMVYLPKIIVVNIEQNATPMQMILDVGKIALMIMLLTTLEQFIQSKNRLHTTKANYCLEEAISKKAMDTDYEIIDRPSTQVKIQKAYELMRNEQDGGFQGILEYFIFILANVLGFTIYTGILSQLHPLIVPLVIVSAILNYFVNRFVNKWIFKHQDNWLKLDYKLAYLTYKSSSFEAAKDIRLYKMNGWFQRTFEKFMNLRIKWTIKMQGMYYLANITEILAIVLRDGVAYAFLIYLVWNQKITVSDFVLYFGLISGFSSWCIRIISGFTKINYHNLAICNLRDYLEYPDRMNRKKGYSLPNQSDLPCEIKFDHVSYQYHEDAAATLQDITFTIHPGEKIALVGSNGAGKTTLVKLLCGLYLPTTGTVSVNGHSSLEYNRDEFYQLFSPVFQDIRLLPISIEKNITLCDKENVDQPRLKQCLELSGMDEVIKRFSNGLDTLLIKDMNEGAVQLSGGQEQKLMLARALYKDAAIMVLDEPTAALDPIAENDMYLKYNELTKQKTSIFISHRLASTRFCDRILLIEQGKIVESGTHDELLALGGQYANMFEIQAKYYREQEAQNA